MSCNGQRNHRERGFSLIELLAVSGMLLVLGAMATPTMINVIANVRLRGGMNSLAGILHECRAVAIRDNTLMSTRFTVMARGPVAYLKPAATAESDAGLLQSDEQVGLGAPVTKVDSLLTTSTSASIPTPLGMTELGFTPVDADQIPTFNSRGLPCLYTAPTCGAGNGFAFYFTDTRALGGSGWGAVSISPAGRIKVWIWNGTAWKG